MCTKTQKILCGDQSCNICFERSFASCDINKVSCWSSKNIKSPIQVCKGSSKKYWFKCNKCPHEFDQAPVKMLNGNNWCPYCANKKLCDDDACDTCFNKSFASHEKAKYWSIKNSTSPRNIFQRTGKKYWFDCPKCQHDFNTSPDNILGIRQCWCPYCGGLKLCENEFCAQCWDNSFESHYRSLNWDFEKNAPITPRDVFRCGARYWFICDNGHSFSALLGNITRLNSWCPHCTYKTQKKLYEWLQREYYDIEIQTEISFDWSLYNFIRKCRFDFYIPSLNLLIELDGLQHFIQVHTWESPENVQKIDLFKMQQAKKNNKSLIRILQEDVWYDTINWRNILRGVIKKYDTPQIICIGDRYKDHHGSWEI